ncbi:potassium-transporting ATPase subunit KdpC [Azoarcus indigens]|uniref:Potassium-transporting ATPase KdpC subunit n=1 Tax=Azoarcus indigens TaxID=29545 RepID=A0A4R6DRQ3_9RHOO|nr:potassium-transporting ATPase subunit KdpC [Azoarcus indigens]NMG65874.1 potassium-transporting ATPase subunit KdpC [Azoarcus indigens]TDN47726.1 K+-transporting ATPase ATPase C chain [Azoarcus indigens]
MSTLPHRSLLRPALVLFLALSLLTGLAYPLLITALAQALFPAQAAGSLLLREGKPVGSALIGQSFSGPEYFWSRPSATAPLPYNAAASGGANQGPTNPALLRAVEARVAALRAAHPEQPGPVPADLATTSASGLDPHISLAAAGYQLERVARARGLPPQALRSLLAEHAEQPLSGFLGEAQVNVLQLNLALDELAAGKRAARN